MKEQEIQKEILQELLIRGIPAWRINTRAVSQTWGRKRYFFWTAPKGHPDLLAVLPGGRLLGIEVKGAKGKTSEAQEKFLGVLRKAGALTLVARAWSDVETLLERISMIVVIRTTKQGEKICQDLTEAQAHLDLLKAEEAAMVTDPGLPGNTGTSTPDFLEGAVDGGFGGGPGSPQE